MARKTSATSKPKTSITNNIPVALDPTITTPASTTSTGKSAIAADETFKAEPRKLEIVKNDSRKNIVPINLDEEIRRRAYELAERRGFTSGHENEDWLAAEREVLQRYHQQSA
jgi:hypothetical protein